MKLRAEKLVKKYGVRTVVKGVSMEHGCEGRFHGS